MWKTFKPFSGHSRHYLFDKPFYIINFTLIVFYGAYEAICMKDTYAPE